MEIIRAGQLEDMREANGRVYDPEGLSPTIITPADGGHTAKIIRGG